MSRVPVVPSALLAIAATLGAQTPARPPRPVASPTVPYHFPRVVAESLPNGLRVYVAEDHAVPVVAVRVLVSADSTQDPRGKEGLSRVMLDALREGTTQHTADQLAEAGAAIGTAISPIAFTTTTNRFSPALAIMAEMLMHPSFDSAGMERRKAQAVARARGATQQPATAPRRIFYANALGADDPVVRYLGATANAANAITRADVVRAYAGSVGPRTTSIVIAGDVTPAEARARVAELFGGWKSDARPTVSTSVAVPVQKPTTIYLYDTPGTDALLYVGSLGPTRQTDDAFASEALGSVFNARLQRELRDRGAYMYQGNSGIIWRADTLPSVFVGSMNVSPAKIDSALVSWLDLLKRFRTSEPVTASELEASVQRLVGPLPSRIDGADALANSVLELVRDNAGLTYRERYARGIAALTPAVVNAAVQRYLDTGHLIIVASGDRKIIEPALRATGIAPVVVVDATGKPIP